MGASIECVFLEFGGNRVRMGWETSAQQRTGGGACEHPP